MVLFRYSYLYFENHGSLNTFVNTWEFSLCSLPLKMTVFAMKSVHQIFLSIYRSKFQLFNNSVFVWFIGFGFNCGAPF